MESKKEEFITVLENWGAEPQQVLDDTFGGDLEFYQTCLKKFAQDDQLHILKNSMTPEQLDTAIRVVHTIKGNADYLGLFPLMDAAITVLKDLRENRLPKAITDLPALEAAYAQFFTLMKPYLA